MNALISIVIPCYKGEKYLAETIESCLHQTYRDLEIIIVDDASPDRCAEIGDEYAQRDPRIRVIRQEHNGGVARAFNSGFNVARGNYFTRLAQDDVFLPDALRSLVQFLDMHPDIGLVYADEQRINTIGQIIRVVIKPPPEMVLMHGNKVGLCVLWRRSVWEQSGEFNPEFDTAEDYEYWLRVQDRFQLGYCTGTPLLAVRVHTEMGSQVFAARQSILAARIQKSRCKSFLTGRRIMATGYYDAAYDFRRKDRFREALSAALQAIVYWPLAKKSWKLLAALVFNHRRKSI